MSVLQDVGLYDDASPNERQNGLSFLSEARHIAALVGRHIGRLKTPNFWRIAIICTPRKPKRNLVVIGGVLDVYLPIDLGDYYRLDAMGRKRFALDALAQGLALATKYTGIGKSEFPDAIQKSESLINEYPFPKSPRSSPNRKWKAHLWCCHEIDRFTAHLVIMDRQMVELTRVFLFKARPSEFDFVRLMDVPYWVTNDEIDVCGKSWKWNSERKTLKKFNPESDSGVS
jgi:hypothetical protein